MFRFRATESDQPTLIYVSLLPNQKPAATMLMLDDFELTATAGIEEMESRTGNLALDADFNVQVAGTIQPPFVSPPRLF